MPFPTSPRDEGFFTFGTLSEINEAFSLIGRFAITHEIDLLKFVNEGSKSLELEGRDASNIAHSMLRQAWNLFCREKGLLEHKYSSSVGFHVSKENAKLGQRIAWGKQGDRRSSMLRNSAKGQVWQFGVSTLPAFWPFPHYKLKSRVLFAPLNENEAGDPFDDAKKQHRLRRTICKGWRNKQWHRRVVAFIELLSGELTFITLPVPPSLGIILEAAPLLFSSPVSTNLPNELDDADEEADPSTLGRPDPDEEEP